MSPISDDVLSLRVGTVIASLHNAMMLSLNLLLDFYYRIGFYNTKQCDMITLLVSPRWCETSPPTKQQPKILNITKRQYWTAYINGHGKHIDLFMQEYMNGWLSFEIQCQCNMVPLDFYFCLVSLLKFDIFCLICLENV